MTGFFRIQCVFHESFPNNDIFCSTKVDRERNIGFEALTVSYTPRGDYILVGGCNKQCVLFSSEGVKLSTIGNEEKSWIWACAAHPTAPFVVILQITS